jgi:Uma2 family endonuclease
MSAQQDHLLTSEEYFALEERAEVRHEYHRGRTYAMTGASARHNLIVGNVIAGLHGQLRKSACRVYPSDLRLKIEQSRSYVYPDISVVCGALQLSDDRPDTITNPTMLVEVLSPSTENYDRGQKFELYRTVESLQEYLVIAQDRLHVEHYIRQADHRWLLVDFYLPEHALRLAAIQCALTLADIYEHVEFDKI